MARVVGNLGVRLSELERREEVIGIRRDAFLPDLAGSLGLGEVSGVGGVGEALVARANDGDLQPFETQMIYST